MDSKGTNGGARIKNDGTGRRDGRLHFRAPVVDGGCRDGGRRLAQWIFAGTSGGTIVLVRGQRGFSGCVRQRGSRSCHSARATSQDRAARSHARAIFSTDGGITIF